VGESVRYRIESQPPKFVRDGESDIMDSIVAQIGENQDYAFLFDTEISAAGAGSFDCRVYSLFKEGDLELALSELNLDGVESVNHSPNSRYLRAASNDRSSRIIVTEDTIRVGFGDYEITDNQSLVTFGLGTCWRVDA